MTKDPPHSEERLAEIYEVDTLMPSPGIDSRDRTILDHQARMAPEAIDQRLLIVEDHYPTAQLIASLVEKTRPSISTQIVQNGNECLTVLRGEAETAVPDLVLLDLDLPVVNGLTVLETRSEDPGIRHVPTIVCSGTDDHATIEECYDNGANAFLPKPRAPDQYEVVADTIIEFWFTVVELPGSRS